VELLEASHETLNSNLEVKLVLEDNQVDRDPVPDHHLYLASETIDLYVVLSQPDVVPLGSLQDGRHQPGVVVEVGAGAADLVSKICLEALIGEIRRSGSQYHKRKNPEKSERGYAAQRPASFLTIGWVESNSDSRRSHDTFPKRGCLAPLIGGTHAAV
jgi:hypothetical protein